MEELLHQFVVEFSPVVVHILEIIGILIIVYGSFRSLWIFFREGLDLGNTLVKITLGEALALSLEFKLGAEIIKTVIIRDINELIILAFVVVLRIALTLLIHWEVNQANIAGNLHQKRKWVSPDDLDGDGEKDSNQPDS